MGAGLLVSINPFRSFTKIYYCKVYLFFIVRKFFLIFLLVTDQLVSLHIRRVQQYHCIRITCNIHIRLTKRHWMRYTTNSIVIIEQIIAIEQRRLIVWNICSYIHFLYNIKYSSGSKWRIGETEQHISRYTVYTMKDIIIGQTRSMWITSYTNIASIYMEGVFS